MIRNVLKLTPLFLLLTSSALWADKEGQEDVVRVKKDSNSCTLTVAAVNVLLGKVLRELAEKCTVGVIVYEKSVLSHPVSVHFQDLSIEEGIKRILRAAGIKNHLIRYRNNGGSEPAEVVLLGSGGKGEVPAFPGGAGEGVTGGAGGAYGDHSPEAAFPAKVESFKERYQWEDAEMRELADYLLWIMPDPARGPGMEELVKALDRRVAEEDKDTVDEELFYRALGDILPSPLKPFMMESVKRFGRNYKEGKGSDASEKSPDQIYREFMEKERSTPQRGQ